MDTKALKQKILDLAIRGKLVPQDPNDEPASVLLERIRAKKQQMVKDGKLKPNDIKNDSVIFKGDDNLHYEKFSDGTVKCIEDEIPFDVPDNWKWVRLGAICPYGDNKAIPSDSISESSWILDLEDIEKDTGLIKHYVTKTDRNSVSNKYAFTTGQLLYSKLRPYLNKVVIATKDGYCTTEILPLIFYGNISAKYMQIFMMSPTFLAYVNMLSYGLKMPRLGTSDGKNALIAIPPINEQLRIRKQFDIIIPLLRKIEKHSDALYSNVLATKSKILDLAIRGKLIPQDPNDEPASVLLERIRAEKEELIKQGKIKRNKKESVIFKGSDNSYYEKIGNDVTCIDDEIPFDIPPTWNWCRLGTIGDWAAGATPNRKNSEYFIGNIPWLKTGDLNDNYITYIPEHISEKALQHSSLRLNPTGSVLIAMYGATIGKLGILTFPATTNQACCACLPFDGIDNKYLFYYLMSQKSNFIYSGVGGAQSNISKEKIISTLFPLPPKEEQHMILSQIEKLMKLIRQFEELL